MKHYHLVPCYLLFMQHVLKLLTWLVLPRILDWLGWDAEEMNVLAFDRSSTWLLENLISPFAIIPGVL